MQSPDIPCVVLVLANTALFSGSVANGGPATCYCVIKLSMMLPTPSCQPSSYCHSIVTETLHKAASCAGHSFTCERCYRQLDPSAHSSGIASGDVCKHQPEPTAVDTVVTHSYSATSIANGSADTPSAAAASTVHSLPRMHRVPGLKFMLMPLGAIAIDKGADS
jgi:hypothetical protein